MPRLDAALVERLHRSSRADRWGVDATAFAVTLERSAEKLHPSGGSDLARSLAGLHLEDLALACACERGLEPAWEHFVREYRPTLYRSATAIAGDDGRELADSLYADLFGLREREGARQSLFRYFHGRSSLATWLGAVLAQRHVDLVRARRRVEPLPEGDDPATPAAPAQPVDEESPRQAARVRAALAAATARLSARDRLRLAWYYAQGMTLAQIGRLCQEHEATVSRHLSRTRAALRTDVEAQLREAGLGAGEIDECFAAAAADPGDANLSDLLGSSEPRKESGAVRSTVKERS
jgi:RNA polymerase sigma-70 factor (ECF subfamily)